MAADLPQEYGHGRLKSALIFFVDVMTGIPSIVAGLFAYALFALFLGPGVRLGVVGAVALSVLMIPIVVRSTEEMLKIVPNGLREASYALGVPEVAHDPSVVLPTALPGIVTGVMVAVSRVIGETAPLLITTGTFSTVNWNPFAGRMPNLPVFAYRPVPEPRGAQGPLHRPRLGRGPHADHHRHAAERDRRLRLPSLSKGGPLMATQARRDSQAPEPGATAADAPGRTPGDRRGPRCRGGRHRGAARHRGHRSRPVLRRVPRRQDVTMSIKPNAVTAFIGSSGCGKSTVLRSLNRMHEIIAGARAEGTGADRRAGHLRPERRPGRWCGARWAWSSRRPTRSRRCRSTTTSRRA